MTFNDIVSYVRPYDIMMRTHNAVGAQTLEDSI